MKLFNVLIEFVEIEIAFIQKIRNIKVYLKELLVISKLYKKYNAFNIY